MSVSAYCSVYRSIGLNTVSIRPLVVWMNYLNSFSFVSLQDFPFSDHVVVAIFVLFYCYLSLLYFLSEYLRAVSLGRREGIEMYVDILITQTFFFYLVCPSFLL